MGASTSTCSSSTTIHGGKYDLFVNFRGEDIRDSFRSHFCEALFRKKIHFFVDDKLERGDEIWPALSKAIADSQISVVIFSEKYASSKWCLRELVKILECKKTKGQIVIPVFYHIDPSHVRKQTGSFADAFVNNHENVSEDEKQIWRAALTEVSDLSGFDSSAIRPESKLVEEIVKDVTKKLKDISHSSGLEGLVGIRPRIERVKELLCVEKLNFEIVGIWGMGGIGKTTIAKAVFTQICGQFECHHFIANVREESERCNGLVLQRERVLSEILEGHAAFRTPNISQFDKDRLKRKKVLIILDDVTALEQLETLAEGIDGFGPGSRIIITTRDKHLFCEYEVNKIYEVEAFDNDEARELFCKYAFKQDNPHTDFTELVDKVVQYAKGSPLALKVVGSSLRGKTKQDWESALHKLKKISNPKIHKLLRISYDGLDSEEKDIFLDIACFFKGEYRDFVTGILNGCYYSVPFGLNVLVDKSLITILEGKIEMHDLLQEMGHELVRQESFNKPGERSRLHNHDEVCLVLRRNMGTEALKGILLDMSKIKNIYTNPRVFERMLNLRILKFKFYNPMNRISNVHGPNYLPDELRYLCWDGYPSKALPSSFSLENLVELDLCYSNLEQLWEGKMDAPKLKQLDLSSSLCLTRIPEFSNAPCLESLYLRGTAIEDVPPSIGSLIKLSDLDLSDCARLKHISPNICKLKSLRDLSFRGCSNLETFPEIFEVMESMEKLDLSKTSIKELPISIENMNGLLGLTLYCCENLERLPSSICDLRFLSSLTIFECPKLDKLPENLGNLKSLDHLNATRTAICQLPSSLTSLEKLTELECCRCRGLTLPPMSGLLHSLRKLDLKECNLTKIPEDIGCLSSLAELELNGNDFESLPKSIKQLSKLWRLHLNNCNRLRSLLDLPLGLSYLEVVNCKKLQSLPDAYHFVESVIESGSYRKGIEYIFTNCVMLDRKVFSDYWEESLLKIQREKGYEPNVVFRICFPGSDIPKWLSYQSFGSCVNFQLPLNIFGNCKFLGFAFWVVLGFDQFCMNLASPFRVQYQCRLGTDIFYGEFIVGGTQVAYFAENLLIDLDHVVLGYHGCSDHAKLFTDEYITCSFNFSFHNWFPPGCKVKYCGVHPIYQDFGETSRSGRGVSDDHEGGGSGTKSQETLQWQNSQEPVKIYGVTIQDIGETSGKRSQTSNDRQEEVEPHPKRFCTRSLNLDLSL